METRRVRAEGEGGWLKRIPRQIRLAAKRARVNLLLYSPNIGRERRKLIQKHLEALSRDPALYEHSLEVARLARKSAKKLGLNKTDLFVSGLLHDIGKTRIEVNGRRRGDLFDGEERKKTEQHVVEGYELLKKEFPLAASVALLHHLFGERKYPEKGVPPEAMKYAEYAKWVGILDAYEARKNRKDRPEDEKNELIQDWLLNKHVGAFKEGRDEYGDRVNELFEAGILRNRIIKKKTKE